MRIGEVARRAEVNIQTLRYYERRGLVVPKRAAGSTYREYPETAVAIVLAIRWAQGLGFSLEEIGELLQMNPGSVRKASTVQMRARATVKLEEIDRRISHLQAMRTTLGRLLEPNPPTTCPLVLAVLLHAQGESPATSACRPSPEAQ